MGFLLNRLSSSATPTRLDSIPQAVHQIIFSWFEKIPKDFMVAHRVILSFSLTILQSFDFYSKSTLFLEFQMETSR